MFVGLLGHVFCVGIKDFLPSTFLERVVMYEYEDELEEDPIPYDERLRVRYEREWMNRKRTTILPSSIERLRPAGV